MTTLTAQLQRPLIALVGRSNVGKSTLFNRLVGSRKAVVSSVRGTTRDRLYGHVVWRGVPLTLSDMGGFEFGAANGISAAVQRHIERALEEADGFLFVCDAAEGLVPADEMIMERLHKTGKPVLLTVNKMDDRLVVPPEFFAFKVAEVFPVSALHGRGTGELLDDLVKRFGARAADSSAASRQAAAPPSAVRRVPAVAIVGRQNVGKSSLLNALLREERVIVSETPGTTRDAIDTVLQVDGQPVLLIDTAGLRHRRKVKNPVDLFSMARTIEAITRSDVVLVVLDSTEGVTRDDRRIIAHINEAGRGLVLVFNKWDLLTKGNERALADTIRRGMPAIAAAPVLAISAQTGFNVVRALACARQVFQSMERGLTAQECTALLERAWAAQAIPRFRGRLIHLQQACWIHSRPAVVELTTTPAGWLPPAYQQYLLRQLRRHPRLAGVPIRLGLKTSGRRRRAA